MRPELIKKVDVFCAGTSIGEALAREFPWGTQTPPDEVEALLTQGYRPRYGQTYGICVCSDLSRSEMDVALAQQLGTIIESCCWNRNPNDRQTMDTVYKNMRAIYSM